MPGQKEPRFCSSFFVDCSGACFAKVSEPRSDLRREHPGQLQMDLSSFCRLRRQCVLQLRRDVTTTIGQGLGENLENVITLKPVGNPMVGGRCELGAAEHWGVDDSTR